MYFFSNSINASFEDAVAATKDALRRHGFEVLTEVDMRKAFRKNLALDFPAYVILCAYDPTLTHRAIQIHDEIGSALFCNVVVQQRNDGHIGISAADPAAFMYVTNHVELEWIAREIRDHLERAIEAIEGRPETRRYAPPRDEPGSRRQLARELL